MIALLLMALAGCDKDPCPEGLIYYDGYCLGEGDPVGGDDSGDDSGDPADSGETGDTGDTGDDTGDSGGGAPP